MEFLRNQICLLGVKNTKPAFYTCVRTHTHTRASFLYTCRSLCSWKTNTENELQYNITLTQCIHITVSEEAQDVAHLICFDCPWFSYSLLCQNDRNPPRTTKSCLSFVSPPMLILIKWNVSYNFTASCCSAGRGKGGSEFGRKAGREGKKGGKNVKCTYSCFLT